MESVKEMTQYVTDEAGAVVEKHPLYSALTSFGAGMGVGLLAALLLPDPSRSRREILAERILENMSRVVPDSVSRRAS